MGIDEKKKNEKKKRKLCLAQHIAMSHMNALHDCTTVLFEKANNLGKVFLDLLFVVHLLCALLLLLLVALLVALLLRRISLLLLLVSKRVGSLVLGLPMMRLIVLLGLTIASRRDSCSTSKIDVDSAFIMLGVVLEALLLADLLDARLDLLNVVDRVIALADNAAADIRDIERQQTQQTTYTCRWFWPVLFAYLILCSRISSASSTN